MTNASPKEQLNIFFLLWSVYHFAVSVLVLVVQVYCPFNMFLNILKEQEVLHGAEDWLTAAIQSLKKASPTSLKISLRSVSVSIPSSLVH